MLYFCSLLLEVIKLALEHSLKIVSEESLKKDFHNYI